MSQNFKLKFDKAGDAASSDEKIQSDQSETFDTPGHVRNLCFVWPDGRKKFLNYAYLVSGEYSPDDGSITLVFTSDTVVIKGSGLDGLFDEILGHLPKRIICTDGRYIAANDKNTIIINEIFIEITV